MQKWILMVMVYGLGLCAGCGTEQTFVTPDRLQRGLVVVLPGIEGRDSGLADNIAKGLDQGGVNWAIEIYDWTSAWGPLYNQRAQERNRLKAQQLSHRIRRYQAAYPDRPVVLVGQSGGGAIAVWATEELTETQSIKGILLINVALSREYSLVKALERTQQGIVSYYSSRDLILLGVGTTVYGTMDGRHGAAAGMEQFDIPPDKTYAYRNLYEIGWSKEMSKTGHRGMHLTSAAKDFVARYLAPMVLDATWNYKDIEALQRHLPFVTTGTPAAAPGEER